MTEEIKLSVLLVEDEYLIRELLKQTVPWHEAGFFVAAEASSAEEALDILGRKRFDLIMADICLPRRDGIDMALAARELAPQTPVLILSGHDNTEYARRSIRAGVWDYILKPIVPAEIKSALLRARKRIVQDKAPELPRESALPPATDPGYKSWGVLDEIRSWIHEHLADEDLSLRRAAAEFLLNASYLSRRFKQAYGASFVEYVNDLRIRKAMELARDHSLSAAEIGRRIGLADAHYFSILFKKHAACTLTQYRQGQMPGQ